MSSEKIHNMTTEGPIELDLSVSDGKVNITVDPKAVCGRIRVHTSDSKGRVADAVNGTKITESGTRLTVSVPDDQIGGAGVNVVQVGGSNYSAVNTGVTIGGGDVWVGGYQGVVGGRVVAQQGSVIAGTGTITVDVVLPVASSLRMSTKNAETIVRGDLETIRFNAHNGSLRVGGVKVLEAKTHNGSITVDAVEAELDVSAHNGPITIGAYGGHRGSARTHNGGVAISATPASSGRLSVRTHNGNIRVRGADHLDLKTSTHRGQVR